MKTVLLSLLFVASTAQAGVLAHFSTDQTSYTVGSKAIVFVTYDRLPTNPEEELASEIRVNDEIVPVIPLSDRTGIAIPKPFAFAGPNSIDQDVYLQNKSSQRAIDEGIAFYQIEIDALRAEQDKEQDPDAWDLLQQRIEDDQQTIRYLNAQKREDRTLRELNHVEFMVTPGRRGAAPQTVTFSTALDHANGLYQVGERATLFAHVLTDFMGPDGPKEKILRATLDGTSLLTQFNGADYFFRTSSFASAAIGSHTLNVTYLIRSKAQADLLRSAKVAALKRQAAYEKSKGESASAPAQAYFQIKINELNTVVAAIDQQLEAILTTVESGTVSLAVTN